MYHYRLVRDRLLVTILLFLCLMASYSFAGDISLDFIGVQTIPYGYQFRHTLVGGLSALDYDVASGHFVAISDDRSQKNPARFYDLKLDYDLKAFHGIKVTGVHFMKRPDGSLFPKPELFGKSSVDPEAIAFMPGGRGYFWTSEGHAKFGVNPFVREMTPDGGYLRDFTVPEKFLPGKGRGIRDNLAFEGLTMDMDRKTILVATEGPLRQDGDEATARHEAVIRLIQFDVATGRALHEYAYPVSPVHRDSFPLGKFSVNGVSAILAVDGDRYITVERSFAAGVGLSVKLYLISLRGATDVSSMDSLKGAHYQPVEKQLLLDTGRLGIAIDNLEGISFGKGLRDGRRSLLLISDDNFRPQEVTQILLFAVRIPPRSHRK